MEGFVEAARLVGGQLFGFARSKIIPDEKSPGIASKGRVALEWH
jgi:hypothetical protein